MHFGQIWIELVMDKIMSLPNACVEAPTPNVTVYGDGAFGR